jgi:hypothetical protein
MARPEIKFDITQVELMGRFRATYETMADWFGCSYKTIERKMSDSSGEFCRAYKKGYANVKMKISEAQVKYALRGNATLLVWLGKQHLGQTDKPQDRDRTLPTINISGLDENAI